MTLVPQPSSAWRSRINWPSSRYISTISLLTRRAAEMWARRIRSLAAASSSTYPSGMVEEISRFGTGFLVVVVSVEQL